MTSPRLHPVVTRLLVVVALGAAPGCIEANRPGGGAVDSAASDVDILVGADIDYLCDEAVDCNIAGTCVRDGERRPGSPCEACQVEVDRTSWTTLSDGTACDDEVACTLASACLEGVCEGEPEPECVDPPKECVSEVICDDVSCARQIKEAWCLIDGACHGKGTTKLGSPCLVCDPERDARGWSSNDGAACSDGDTCTVEDECVGRICQGSAMDCDDGVLCTTDGCVNGGCYHEIVEGKCYIDQACWDVGDRKPDAPCKGCTPAAGAEWQILSGAACETGDPCDDQGTCQGETCVADLLYVDDESAGDAAYVDLTSASGYITEFPFGFRVGNLNPLVPGEAGNDLDRMRYKLQLHSPSGHYHPRVRVAGVPQGFDLRVCLTVQCGITEQAAHKPNSLSCPEGGAELEYGTVGGCCEVAAPDATGALTLETDARCDDDSSIYFGYVYVEIEGEAVTSLPQQCAGYTLEWGAVANVDGDE